MLVRIADDGHLRNFDFKEKAEVDKYYPQYYHKTDKVRWHFLRSPRRAILAGYRCFLFSSVSVTGRTLRDLIPALRHTLAPSVSVTYKI